MEFRLFVLSCLLSFAFNANAQGISIGSDFIVAGTYEKTGGWPSENNVSLRTHNTLFYGFGSFDAGALFQYERNSGDSTDMIIGGGVRYGKKYFIELDAGYLRRDFGSYTESGLGFVVQLGRYFPLSSSLDLSISLPVVFKYVTSGISNKKILNYIPYLGLRFTL